MDTNILTRVPTSDSSSSSSSDQPKNVSTSSAVNVTEAVTTTVNNDPVLSQPARRGFQNSILIWLDSNIDETKEYFKNALKRLRHVVPSATIFTDSQECLNFISEIKQKKIFMIISGSLGQYIVPAINAWPQLDSIYVFCREPAFHKQWSKMILKQQQLSTKTPPTCFRVFRGQGLSLENFEKMIKTEGGLLSVNNFLSASRNLNASLHNYAYPATRHPDLIGILLVITIDPKICATSSIHFADVKTVDQNEGRREEEEILFSTHTIFRIDRIKRIHDDHTDRLWQVNLTPIGDGNHDMNTLTLRLRQELTWKIGWSRVSEILMRMGEPLKAEHLCKIELDKASSDQERADYNNQLGKLYAETGKYSRALSSYKRALHSSMKILPTNHSDLADAYRAIGMVYFQMGEHSKALSSLTQSIDIQKLALITDDIKLVDSYDNIGMVYFQMGNYSKALSSFQRSLEIQKLGLPVNHLVLASSYTRIGNAHAKMNEYSEALSSFKKALEIQKVGLPSKHPDFAETYKNIGAMYKHMGMFSKAVRSQERALQIKNKEVSSNHQGLIIS
ncbi:unnamed protein product [Rotaria socialis]|uniref:Kinesin light chain n=1 Tax=Rotaria socialis TaxID=392032 RepID=A0A821EQR1_9BILA|nr:unnamed protein product [Rotaria socialis]